jgi:hypothetical protein
MRLHIDNDGARIKFLDAAYLARFQMAGPGQS